MKKTIRDIVVLAVLAVALAGLSMAQEVTDRIAANVPFSFNAGGQRLPAGEYQFVVNEQDHTVTLYNNDTRRAEVISTLSFDGGYTGKPAIEFDVIAGTHVLTNVRTFNAGVKLPEQNVEVASRERGKPVATVASLH